MKFLGQRKIEFGIQGGAGHNFPKVIMTFVLTQVGASLHVFDQFIHIPKLFPRTRGLAQHSSTVHRPKPFKLLPTPARQALKSHTSVALDLSLHLQVSVILFALTVKFSQPGAVAE